MLYLNNKVFFKYFVLLIGSPYPFLCKKLSGRVTLAKGIATVDEMAFYNQELPQTLIYQHYLDIMQGNHYSNVDSTNPAVIPIPDPVAGNIDTLEFPPGHIAGDPGNYASPNQTIHISAVNQLKSFPLPRYKIGHTLLRNFPWLEYRFFGSVMEQGITMPEVISNSVMIQTELASNFNYYLLLVDNVYNGRDTAYLLNQNECYYHWIKLANDSSDLPLALTMNWHYAYPIYIGKNNSKPYIFRQNLDSIHYLKDDTGGFILNSKNNKQWSPEAPSDSLKFDGQAIKYFINNYLKYLSRPIDIIGENGEEPPDLYGQNLLEQDPYVVSKKDTNISWESYESIKKTNFRKVYRNQFIDSIPALDSTLFTWYKVAGISDPNHKYSEARYINSKINNQYYSTPDFYTRWPWNWRGWNSAAHGWEWIVESRHEELMAGDKLFSPFIGAGWSKDPENDVRPAQWLGLLYCKRDKFPHQ